MRVLTKLFIGAAVSTLALACLSPVGLYLYGLTLLPMAREPASPDRVPPIARTLLWHEFGGTGEPEIAVLNPYTSFIAPAGPGLSLATVAGRMLFRQEVPKHQWRPAFFAAVVWTSRRWSADEALSTVLTRAYFGHGFHGLDSAAEGYFGLPSAALTPFETAQLVVLTRSPSRYDLWCRQEANQERAGRLLAGLAADRVTRRLKPPLGDCP